MNFWKEFEHPILALAPMEDVTDTVFREIVLSVSTPKLLHVAFTEFTSVDGLLHEKGFKEVAKRLFVTQSERKLLKEKNVKLVAQIWGSDPDKFFKVAQKLTNEYEFDGIDINMGCPVKKIIKNKCCSALILYPKLAKEIIQATKEGTYLPVSVKTRLGFNNVDTENWISNLLSVEPEVITIHGRTQKMQSEGSVLWNEVEKAVQLKKSMRSNCKILGNGDILSIVDAYDKIDRHGLNGIMIGRGIFKNVRFFESETEANIEEDTNLMLLQKHVNLYKSTWQGSKNYAILKRFFKIYLNGFYGAANLRAKLMETSGFDDFEKYVHEHLKPTTTYHQI